MSWKAIGKGFLKVGRLAAPFIGLALPGSTAAAVATTITELTNRAEAEFAEKDGPQKAEFVTVGALQVLELTTGKNYDSPQGRALIKDLSDVDVEIKDTIAAAVAPLQAKYQEKLSAVTAYIESVKAPAQADTV
jgi:hypothetical protein